LTQPAVDRVFQALCASGGRRPPSCGPSLTRRRFAGALLAGRVIGLLTFTFGRIMEPSDGRFVAASSGQGAKPITSMAASARSFLGNSRTQLR
jgi:hypothetical protein